MSESSGTPGPLQWLGVLNLRRAVFPQASLGRALFTLPKCNCRGSGVLSGLGANTETDNLLGGNVCLRRALSDWSSLGLVFC
jgi:hypothetical protein